MPRLLILDAQSTLTEEASKESLANSLLLLPLPSQTQIILNSKMSGFIITIS